MKKYLIKYDAGYGEIVDVIEAKSFEEAEKEVYSQWLEAVQAEGFYTAEPLTPELAEEYHFDCDE